VSPAKPSTDLIVRLNGVQLSDDARARINASVQAAVLKEIAALDIAPKIVVQFPREWLGLWLDEVARLKIKPPPVPEISFEQRG
jgi:hypothetical protein